MQHTAVKSKRLSKKTQVRLVSAKAERPNQFSHGAGVSQLGGGVLHDNDNTDVTP